MNQPQADSCLFLLTQKIPNAYSFTNSIIKPFDLMKKARFKMMLVAVFAAFALVLGTKEAGAQTGGTSSGIFTPPQGNYVSPAEADVLLTTHVVNLKNLLLTLVPGTNAYKTVERAIFYYSTIHGEVLSGKDIPNSIVTSLLYVAQDPYGSASASKTALMDLRNEAIDMLDQ